VMHPDTREFYAVMEGQVRFTLEGQPEAIVATRGSIVNIPKKTAYSVEVIGDGPALWVAANQQNFKNLYPAGDARPANVPGFTVMKVGMTAAPAPYTGNNKPHFNLFEAQKDPKFAGQNVVQDDHMWAQAIWGYEKNLPPYDPNDKGHFHVGTAEWWIILQGQIRHNIETIGDFTSSEGDIVYLNVACHALRGAGAVVPARHQHVSVHELARATPVKLAFLGPGEFSKVDAFGCEDRLPQVAGFCQTVRKIAEGEIARVHAFVDFGPRQRRGRARKLARARAIRAGQ
jgi:quercetin dioxygenase-like cupin family protein